MYYLSACAHVLSDAVLHSARRGRRLVPTARAPAAQHVHMHVHVVAVADATLVPVVRREPERQQLLGTLPSVQHARKRRAPPRCR